MNSFTSSSIRRQQGAASVAIAMLIMFILAAAVTAVMNMSGSSVGDAAKNEEQVAALFIAESGLERAGALLKPKIVSGTMTDSDCTGIFSTGNSYGVGRGSFSYLSAVPSPTGCISTGTPCTKCSVTVSGAVGSSARTVKLDVNVPLPAAGNSGCGQNVSLTLTNTTEYAATAVFNLAWRRQMSSGEFTASCPNTGAGNVSANVTSCLPLDCVMKWNVESSSGNPSGGSVGSAVNVGAKGNVAPATLSSFTVTQTLSDNRNYVEVGALFPGFDATTPPVIIGAYWDDGNGGNGSKTVNNANSTPSVGLTNSGVATSGGVCTTPSPNHTNNPKQLCTSWCNDSSNTLVFGATGRSGTQADAITNVAFNTTNGVLLSGIPLQRIAHYPNTSGVPAATGDIYSEIWYAPKNLPYLYGAQATEGEGSIAIGVTGATGGFAVSTTNANSTLTVTTVGSGGLYIGDTITGTNIPNGTKITAIGAGATYTMSNNATATATGTTLTSTRDVLTVTGVASGTFELGQTLSSIKTSNPNNNNVPAGTTIVAYGPGTTGTTGTYFLSMTTPQTVTATNRIITGGAISSGTTVTIPTGGTLPDLGTFVTVRSGTGKFSTTSVVKVLAHPTSNTFTVATPAASSTAVTPDTALAGAQICGGTCAFFNDPSSTTSTTEFVVTRSGGTTQWASGFVCLRGVNESKIVPINNITPADYGKWAEVLR